jgi:pyrroloquinoline-quinone synthase
MNAYVAELDRMIAERKKMTSPLYQTILAGKATERLLQAFATHRWPIKSFWTRNILGIASRVDDYDLRMPLVENIYEEETGRLSGSRRHLDTFADFARAVGVDPATLDTAAHLPETDAVIAHNVDACNNPAVHFTAGVASVLLLMEGQPPIVATDGRSMLSVMRDEYRLPPWGYEFFVHHASADAGDESVSELEDEHAAAARELIVRYCDTSERREAARGYLERALELRHRHFDAILREAYDEAEPPFRYSGTA